MRGMALNGPLAPAATPGRARTATPLFSPLNILLVEDSPGDVRLTREAFAEGRVPVVIHVALDGEEALAFVRHQGQYANVPRPALILLDLNLPRKGGREVLAEIKGDPNVRTIPVIVFTTSRAPDDIRACYALHANCYVSKPFDLQTFLDAIRAVVDFWLIQATLPGRA